MSFNINLLLPFREVLILSVASLGNLFYTCAGFQRRPQRNLMSLSTIGRYQVEDELAQGGMGLIYRARDPYMQRQVGRRQRRQQYAARPPRSPN